MKKKALTIGDILSQYLRAEGLETPLQEYRIVQAWPEVTGQAIAKYTSELYIRNGILHVKLKSAALRQNLQMMHTQMRDKLNTHIGSNVISDVKFL